MVPTLAIGTTFSPISIKKQIHESEIIIEAEVLSTEAMRDEDGLIVTKVTLLPDKWIGEVSPDSENIFEVYYPGGILGDSALNVEGTPQFEVGEHVVVMTKMVDEKIYVRNLGLGKFSVKKFGTKDIIVNQIFPNIPNVSQMKLSRFYDLTEWVKKGEFKTRFKDKYELNQEKQSKSVRTRSETQSRAIASAKEQVRANRFSTYWLIIILGIISFIGFIIRKRNNEK